MMTTNMKPRKDAIMVVRRKYVTARRPGDPLHRTRRRLENRPQLSGKEQWVEWSAPLASAGRVFRQRRRTWPPFASNALSADGAPSRSRRQPRHQLQMWKIVTSHGSESKHTIQYSPRVARARPPLLKKFRIMVKIAILSQVATTGSETWQF